MVPFTRVTCVVVAACVVAAAAPADAKLSRKAKKKFKRARKAAMAHYKAERWEEAQEGFEAAMEIDRRAGLLWYVALAYEKQDAPRDALSILEELLAEFPDDKLAAKARKKAEAIESGLPASLLVDCAGVRRAKVRVDSEPRKCGLLITDLEPGEHELEATAPGREDWSETVELEPDERRRVRIKWRTVKAREPPPEAAPAPRPPPSSGSFPWLAVGVAGAGAAILATGVFFSVRGAAERAAYDALHARAGGRGSEVEAQAEAANDEFLMADILYASGLTTLVAAGLVWSLDQQSMLAARAVRLPAGGLGAVGAEW